MEITEIPLENIRELAKFVATSSLSNCRLLYEDFVYGRFRHKCRSEITRWEAVHRPFPKDKLLNFIRERQIQFIEFLTAFRRELFRLNPDIADKIFPIYVPSESFTPTSLKDFLGSDI